MIQLALLHLFQEEEEGEEDTRGTNKERRNCKNVGTEGETLETGVVGFQCVILFDDSEPIKVRVLQINRSIRWCYNSIGQR